MLMRKIRANCSKEFLNIIDQIVESEFDAITDTVFDSHLTKMSIIISLQESVKTHPNIELDEIIEFFKADLILHITNRLNE